MSGGLEEAADEQGSVVGEGGVGVRGQERFPTGGPQACNRDGAVRSMRRMAIEGRGSGQMRAAGFAARMVIGGPMKRRGKTEQRHGASSKDDTANGWPRKALSPPRTS